MNYQVIAALGSFFAATMAVVATFLAWRAARLQLRTSNMAQVFEFQRIIVNELTSQEYYKTRSITEKDLIKFDTKMHDIRQYELILLSIWAGHFAYGRYRKLKQNFRRRRGKSFETLVKLVKRKGCTIPNHEYTGRIITNVDFIYRWPLVREIWSYGPGGITSAVVHATIEKHFDNNQKLEKDMMERWDKIGVKWSQTKSGYELTPERARIK